jgi:UDP-N-acetyl-2-amino-2-deoxyglucuronate dehydrogenase
LDKNIIINLQNLKVALIGCGRVAGHHCLSIAKTKGVSLAAVCDLTEEKAEAYGEEYGIPFFTNYREMLDQHPEIDIVAIITPSGMHWEHTLEIIGDYGKHVIVEKPTFLRPEQAEQAFALADEKGIQIFPVFQNRYNKAVKRVRDAIAAGELGDIRIISVRVRWCRPQQYYDMAPWRGTFSHDGGALTNQCIHHVDLLRHLGGEVASVNAIMRSLGADIEVEDTVVATMSYNNKTVGVLEGTTAARPNDFEASLSIVGSKGLAQIGGVAVNELQVFTPDPKACAINTEDFIGVKGYGAVYGFGHAEMYKDIVGHFVGDAPYPVSREDCISTLRLLHAFYRSDEAGDWVNVDSKEQSQRLGRTNEVISDLYRTPRLSYE